MGKEIVRESQSFRDPVESRQVTLIPPEAHSFTDDQVDEVSGKFSKELANNPEAIRAVVVYQDLLGALTVRVCAAKSEADLHSDAVRWTNHIYGEDVDMPVGHRWSIDRPQSMPGLELVVDQETPGVKPPFSGPTLELVA